MKVYHKTITFKVSEVELRLAGLDPLNLDFDVYCDVRDVFGPNNRVDTPSGSVTIDFEEGDWFEPRPPQQAVLFLIP